jgi:hypothetical protein
MTARAATGNYAVCPSPRLTVVWHACCISVYVCVRTSACSRHVLRARGYPRLQLGLRGGEPRSDGGVQDGGAQCGFVLYRFNR